MRIPPEVGSVAIVLLGAFNPAILRPEWFAKSDLVTAEAAANAEVQVIHREIAIMRMDWVSIQSQTERFIATIEVAPFIRVHDLVMRMYRDFLPHTPLWALGINRRVEFNVKDHASQIRIGRTLAPPSAWGEWGQQIDKQFDEAGTKPHGGMASLTMREQRFEDRPKGFINARVEPSLRNLRTAVVVDINDHYEVEDKEKVDGANDIMTLLERNFDDSIKRSEWIIDQVMALA